MKKRVGLISLGVVVSTIAVRLALGFIKEKTPPVKRGEENFIHGVN